MKKTIIASIAATLLATTAFAGDLDVVKTENKVAVKNDLQIGGDITVELTENANGKYVATTTLGVGMNLAGPIFGGASVESENGNTFTIDKWQLGASVAGATVSIGKQDNLFVGGRMNLVGEDTLTLPDDSIDSIMLSYGDVSTMVAFTDVTSDITDIHSVQLAYSTSISSMGLTGVVDYNNTTDEVTLGADTTYVVSDDISVGAVTTYQIDAEKFGYEAYGSYKFATVFVNGDKDDLVQNLGAGVNYTIGNANMYAEAGYNIDTEENTVGAGISFSF